MSVWRYRSPRAPKRNTTNTKIKANRLGFPLRKMYCQTGLSISKTSIIPIKMKNLECCVQKKIKAKKRKIVNFFSVKLLFSKLMASIDIITIDMKAYHKSVPLAGWSINREGAFTIWAATTAPNTQQMLTAVQIIPCLNKFCIRFLFL